MKELKPKKRLGQHFLKDSNIAKKIVDGLNYNDLNCIIEIGPGMGILTDHLIPFKKKITTLTVKVCTNRLVELWNMSLLFPWSI